ncbi:hypothetical protein AMAG_20723 [Allomyces macrogynus ATCC 38327]|uniref:Uncharacterized protein n=1 Tax=Allomyces macrogynus (strain ATCC 38327) TaxID=578462 RepID=A0A0L0TF08_ALLM3|nr:hypothetical protein AMAG_20723 [Allomyces macrogynus ATCC 38327]|eukprot:KNE73241.1 hypothetical protein AMAG_20723 [Allomyces macrogynus ATCC 38327]
MALAKMRGGVQDPHHALTQSDPVPLLGQLPAASGRPAPVMHVKHVRIAGRYRGSNELRYASQK